MPPYRIEWLEEAKADVRALDQNTAMRMFEVFSASRAPARATSPRCKETSPDCFAYALGIIASCSR